MILSTTPPTSRWGSLALVQYLSEPLRSAVYSLRELIPGKQLPEPHITVLPPRPLEIPIAAACAQVTALLHNVTAFEVELSDVCYFPETNFLYVDVLGGNSKLFDIHGQLNRGDLSYTEVFEFRPHLTLGGPVPVEALKSAHAEAERAWKNFGFQRHVAIDEIVCLWLPAESETREWNRYSSFVLPKESRARAAHVTIHDSKILS